MTRTFPWVCSVVLSPASLPTWPPLSCMTLFFSVVRSAYLRDTALLEFSSTLCPAPKWGKGGPSGLMPGFSGGIL